MRDRHAGGCETYTLALTLDPFGFGDCEAFAFRFCKSLFRKFCSAAFED
jgi:hypothetical protein